MLTPQDVTNREFDKAIFGGYDIAAVDRFLEELSADYSALYLDNAKLKGKLKVLVDKVEEYRNTEDAMHLAFLTAQKTAREITEKAEAKAAEILAEAQKKADELMARAEMDTEARRRELGAELQTEETALLNAKRRTAEYLDSMKEAASAFNASLSDIYSFVPALEELSPVKTAEPPEEPEEEPDPQPEPKEPEPGTGAAVDVDQLAQMIENSYETPAPEPKEEPSRENNNLPNIDYEHLQFGDHEKDKKK